MLPQGSFLRPHNLLGVALVVFGAYGVISVTPARIADNPVGLVTAVKWDSWYLAIADNALGVVLGASLILGRDTLRWCVAYLCIEPFYWAFVAAGVAHLRSRNMISFEDARDIYAMLAGPIARTFMLFPVWALLLRRDQIKKERGVRQ